MGTRLFIDNSVNVDRTTDPGELLDIVGNLKVRGDITAETLIISSSVTNLTTQFLSGSTSIEGHDYLVWIYVHGEISGARITYKW